MLLVGSDRFRKPLLCEFCNVKNLKNPNKDRLGHLLIDLEQLKAGSTFDFSQHTTIPLDEQQYNGIFTEVKTLSVYSLKLFPFQ